MYFFSSFFLFFFFNSILSGSFGCRIGYTTGRTDDTGVVIRAGPATNNTTTVDALSQDGIPAQILPEAVDESAAAVDDDEEEDYEYEYEDEEDVAFSGFLDTPIAVISVITRRRRDGILRAGGRGRDSNIHPIPFLRC
jgi:hypothetical protein